MDKSQVNLLKGYGIEELPNMKTVPRMNFINKEGRVMEGLPADPFHLQKYLARGFRPVAGKKTADVLTCDVCGKGPFKTNFALTGHLRSHTTKQGGKI